MHLAVLVGSQEHLLQYPSLFTLVQCLVALHLLCQSIICGVLLRGTPQIIELTHQQSPPGHPPGAEESMELLLLCSQKNKLYGSPLVKTN